MKNLKRTLAAALVASLALAPAITAMADDTLPIAEPISLTTPEAGHIANLRLPDNMLVSGIIEEINESTIRIVSPDENAVMPEVVVHIGETALILDAVTGDSVGSDKLEKGAFVYVYINNFMTMSLPPQAGAQLILCNAPQGFIAPTYHTVMTAQINEDGTEAIFTTDKGDEFTFGEDVALSPYMTRNMVYLSNILPGTRLLIWQSLSDEADGALAPTKAMLFAYSFEGYFTIEDGALYISGEPVDLGGAAILSDEIGRAMLPLRAVCEALGYTVGWDAELRAAIVENDARAFVVRPGHEIAGLGDTELSMIVVPEILGGLTMVSATDLGLLMNVFYAG